MARRPISKTLSAHLHAGVRALPVALALAASATAPAPAAAASPPRSVKLTIEPIGAGLMLALVPGGNELTQEARVHLHPSSRAGPRVRFARLDVDRARHHGRPAARPLTHGLEARATFAASPGLAPTDRTSRRGIAGATAVAVAALASLGPFVGGASAAPMPVNLGTAASFGVMGGSTATSAGVSTVTGNVGVSPGTSVTGFPPGVIRGNLVEGDAAAAAAHTDIATAYTDAVGRTPAEPIAGDLAGVTLTPGVYASGAAITIAAGGTLTLDAGGDPDGVFILQAGSTLGTGANSNVTLAGGAQACNVFWQVGSSATLGASSTLTGTILASTSISMGDSVTVNGRALARDGAVTLINDTVTDTPCAGSLSNTAPTITPFSLKLTGLNQTVHTTLGAWSVTDATNSNAGYSITVSASTPTVNDSAAAAGTGGSLTLTPSTATAATGQSASNGPIAAAQQRLSPTPSTIENAPVGTGQGKWDFAADSGTGTGTLAIVIPGNANAGNYSSTLTFTTAPPVGG